MGDIWETIPHQKQMGLVRDYQNNKDFLFFNTTKFSAWKEIFQDALHALGMSLLFSVTAAA